MKAFSKAGVCALAIALLAETSGAAVRPYEVVLYGTVRSVNPPARSITIAYAPLDTAAGGIRIMHVTDAEPLAGFRRGDPVQAIADTRRTPWTVRDVRRMR